MAASARPASSEGRGAYWTARLASGLLVAGVDRQAGDVVVSAALVGEVDEDGRRVAVAVAGQHLGQLLDGQVVGQAVGAEYEAVARLHRQPLKVGLDARVEPDRPHVA